MTRLVTLLRGVGLAAALTACTGATTPSDRDGAALRQTVEQLRLPATPAEMTGAVLAFGLVCIAMKENCTTDLVVHAGTVGAAHHRSDRDAHEAAVVLALRAQRAEAIAARLEARQAAEIAALRRDAMTPGGGRLAPRLRQLTEQHRLVHEAAERAEAIGRDLMDRMRGRDETPARRAPAMALLDTAVRLQQTAARMRERLDEIRPAAGRADGDGRALGPAERE